MQYIAQQKTQKHSSNNISNVLSSIKLRFKLIGNLQTKFRTVHIMNENKRTRCVHRDSYS